MRNLLDCGPTRFLQPTLMLRSLTGINYTILKESKHLIVDIGLIYPGPIYPVFSYVDSQKCPEVACHTYPFGT